MMNPGWISSLKGPLMDDGLPPLVERIAENLARSSAPISSADLARRFLALGIVDEKIAVKLIDPILEEDPRFERTLTGWRFRGSYQRSESPDFDGSFLVIWAPWEPPLASAAVFPSGENPLYSLSIGGEAEALLYEQRSGKRAPRPVVSLAQTARRLRGFRGTPDPARLAEHLGAPHVEAEGELAWLGMLAAGWEHLAAELRLEGIGNAGDLSRLLEAALEPADFSGKKFGPEDIEALDEGPGVYVFFDARMEALYVGQSGCLRRRVASYFTGMARDDKDRAIRRQATVLRVHPTDCVVDALLLEQRKIRHLRPRLNTRRRVRGEPPEDGIIAAPTMREGRFVLYTVREGRLVRRTVASSVGRRKQASLHRAVEALWSGEAPERVRLEEAALVGTWLETHPRALWLRPGIDGGPEQILARLTKELGG